VAPARRCWRVVTDKCGFKFQQLSTVEPTQ